MTPNQVRGNRHPARKLTAGLVVKMRARYALATTLAERRRLARQFRDRHGVSQVTIWKALNRDTWRHV